MQKVYSTKQEPDGINYSTRLLVDSKLFKEGMNSSHGVDPEFNRLGDAITSTLEEEFGVPCSWNWFDSKCEAEDYTELRVVFKKNPSLVRSL